MINKINFTCATPVNLQPDSLPISSKTPPSPHLISTISPRANAKTAEGGCCDWIKQLFQKILQFFGLASAPETSSTLSVLEQRIAQGKAIIDEHLQKDSIVNANTPDKAMIIVIQYNGECKMVYGRAQDVKNHSIDVAKTMVREILTRHASASPSAKLRIDTMLVKKNGINDYDLEQLNNRINFANEEREGGSGGFINGGRARLGSYLICSIPDRGHQQTLSNFFVHQF
jgi:hypothetical protein